MRGILVTIKMINIPEAVAAPNAPSVATCTNFYPTIWTCVDQDDGDVPSIADMRQMSKAKHRVLLQNREIRIYLKPTVLTTFFAGLSSGYGLSTPWVDMTRTDVVHYGLHTAFEGLTTGAALTGQYQFRINTKHYPQYKNVS
jgi:hypothetical protein